MKSQRRGPRGPSWLALAVFTPQLVLGCWLCLVPDRVAFTLNQAVVLVHVLAGLVTLPAFCLWVWTHAHGAQKHNPAGGKGVALAGVLLAAGGGLAYASGLANLWTGQGMPLSAWHAALGFAPVPAIALHLALAGKMRAAALCLSGLVAAFGISASVRVTTAGVPNEATTPPFSQTLRDINLYESSAWCGECHVEAYKQWSSSTHARTTTSPFTVPRFQSSIERNGKEEVDNDLTTQPFFPTCSSCHAPVSFYGDDLTPLLLVGNKVAADGISCSFCHTLRGIEIFHGPDVPTHPGIFRTIEAYFAQQLDDPLEVFSLRDVEEKMIFTGHYISAPETVQPYLFQASSIPMLRTLGNLLIRWRPEVHRRDYGINFLAKPQACAGCHNHAYTDWRASSFNTSDPQTRVNCTDCHMADTMTGKPVTIMGQQVPWGPKRPGHTNHYFAGGNARTAVQFKDSEMLTTERRVSQAGITVSINELTLQAEDVRAVVTVKSVRVGHAFPVGEFEGHRVWVGLAAEDDQKRLLLASAPPEWFDAAAFNDATLFANETGAIVASIPANGQADLELTLDLGSNVNQAVWITASVYHEFDTLPIATARVALNASSAGSSALEETASLQTHAP